MLRLNPYRCATIVFSTKKLVPDSNLRINLEDLPWVDSIRILGPNFPYSLNWNAHIALVKQKALKKLRVLKSVAHVSHGIIRKDLIRINNVTVTSMLHHGSPIYLLACTSIRQKLEPILNAALRIATGFPRWTHLPILRRADNTLSIASTQDLHRCCYLFRHMSLGP